MKVAPTMPTTDRPDIDTGTPPFDRFKAIRHLATSRSGRSPSAHARHQLYVAHERRSASPVLIKVTSKPGLVYERNLANEVATLTTINRELPDSRYFPSVREHGRLRDGRIYLITSLFDEFPLATTIHAERMPGGLVGHLRTALEVAKALAELHRLQIVHVDLNPMNILYRSEKGTPVIRIVDFESSYERSRHSTGTFYDPPTTPGYVAPEVSRQAPDARADVYSLGAVLYTMLTGFGWTWQGEALASVEADVDLDPPLRTVLLSAVEPDPDRRTPTAEAFSTALGTYLENIWPGRSW
jgi:serine/threonine protein kinase